MNTGENAGENRGAGQGGNNRPQPTLTFITATDNTLSVHFTESIGTTSNFTDGMTLTIDSVPDAITYSSGQNPIIYTTTTTVVEGDVLVLTYVDSTGLLFGTTSGKQLNDSSDDYTVPGSVIFYENFNALPDLDLTGDCLYDNWGGFCPSMPARWDYLNISEWNPTNPMGRISTGTGRFGEKSFESWDESWGDPNSWAAECQLMKHFDDAQYPEMWATMWLKFNPLANVDNLTGVKIFRMGHYNPLVADGTAGTTIFNTNNANLDNNGYGATTHGMVFIDVVRIQGIEGPSQFRLKVAPRGSPDAITTPPEGNQYLLGDYPNFYDLEITDDNWDTINDQSWTNLFGDGNWHKLEVELKMNSVINASDGICRLYWDGNPCRLKDDGIFGNTNIPFRQTNNPATGFNCFALGGNADNIWDGSGNPGTPTSEEQLFYYIDEVTITETRQSSEIIFQDNFDAQPNLDILGSIRWDGDIAEPDAYNYLPPNWDYIYTTNHNPINPAGRISAVGISGSQGLEVWDESEGDGNSWGHEIQLAKHTNNDTVVQYPEAWLTCWIKWDPNANMSGFNAAKVFRVQHANIQNLDGTNELNVFNTSNEAKMPPGTAAISAEILYDIKQVSGTIYRHKLLLRGDPDFKMDYSGGGQSWDGKEFGFLDTNGQLQTTWETTFGDGNWHKIELRIVVNTIIPADTQGAANGIAELWCDDVFQGGWTNVPYLQGGHTPGAYGLNFFSIAGNMDSVWDGQSEAEQHMYDVDKVIFSTRRQP